MHYMASIMQFVIMSLCCVRINQVINSVNKAMVKQNVTIYPHTMYVTSRLILGRCFTNPFTVHLNAVINALCKI